MGDAALGVSASKTHTIHDSNSCRCGMHCCRAEKLTTGAMKLQSLILLVWPFILKKGNCIEHKKGRGDISWHPAASLHQENAALQNASFPAGFWSLSWSWYCNCVRLSFSLADGREMLEKPTKKKISGNHSSWPSKTTPARWMSWGFRSAKQQDWKSSIIGQAHLVLAQ